MKNKPMKNEISCGILPVYINKNKKREFLLVHQHNDNWSIPKGHVEDGETFLETAKRELFEETGLVCKNIIEDKIFNDTYIIIRPDKSISKIVHYFIGYVTDKNVKIQPEEIQDYFWGNKNEVLSRISFNEAKKSFKEMINYLEK